MNNPEFTRQRWLQLTPRGLAWMTAVLGLCFFTVVASARAEDPAHDNILTSLMYAALALLVTVLGLGGVWTASASIVDEWREKTWEQQRMSAMQPWAMAWGKLLGSTLLVWYGGLLCLVVAWAAAAMHSDVQSVMPHYGWVVLSALLGCAGMHAAAMAIHLQYQRSNRMARSRGAMGWIVLLGLVLVSPVQFFVQSGVWYGIAAPKELLFLGAMALFCICAVCALWRMMQAELGIKTLPWVWSICIPIVAVVLAGAITASSASAWLLLHRMLVTCIGMGVTMTYFALLGESSQRSVWQRVLTRWHTGQHLEALQQLPLWPTSWLVAALCGVLDLAWTTQNPLAPSLLPLVLLCLRDAAIYIGLAFDRKRSPLGIFILIQVLLHLLLPWLIQFQHPEWINFISPWSVLGLLSAQPSHNAILLSVVHAALACGWLAWRWKRPSARPPNILSPL